MEATQDMTFGQVPEDHNAMAVLGSNGDTKHIWSKKNPDDVKEAEKLYGILTSQGYKAYRMKGRSDTRGEQMTAFDPDAQRVLFVPVMCGG